MFYFGILVFRINVLFVFGDERKERLFGNKKKRTRSNYNAIINIVFHIEKVTCVPNVEM